MRRFEFKPTPSNTFTGFNFFNTYKDAPFLKDIENVQRILCEGHQLRQGLKGLQPGESLEIAGMYVEGLKLLAIKKGGANVTISDTDFTFNRLTGLTAAYVYENRKTFSIIVASEARTLGLMWCNKDHDKAKLYLSAVSGTEHFIDQFSYWPLVCALRKVSIKKMNPEFLPKISKVKNNEKTLAQMLFANPAEGLLLWSRFPKATVSEYQKAVKNLDK